MKKVITAALLSMGLSISVFAAQTTPIDTTNRQSAVSPQYAGVSTCIIDNSTGTNAVECTTKPGIILDVIASSVATTDNIVFRDSNTANTTSAALLYISAAQLETEEHIFPRFKNGLSVNSLVAPTGSSATSHPAWTIVYTTDLY